LPDLLLVRLLSRADLPLDELPERAPELEKLFGDVRKRHGRTSSFEGSMGANLPMRRLPTGKDTQFGPPVHPQPPSTLFAPSQLRLRPHRFTGMDDSRERR